VEHCTGQAFHGVNIEPQYDLKDLPRYHLPELQGGRGRRGKHLTRQILVWSLDDRISGYGGQLVKILEG